ncbi:helicase HerA domain-containing protein [Savagea faecisuis]|uniref:Helicase HerA domain-containing protein n=1 Tax=Savagea faecisuis TaxID=1274803 RepID=A0ABW3H0F6_9BACL
MSNQFYKYVANQLTQFFQEEVKKENVGRYYLQLPSIDISEQLFEIFEAMSVARPFIYKHEEGSETYETIALHYGEYKYVIAVVNDNIAPSFLVTLRNAMSLQKGQWENTSLVLLTSSVQDSIKDGSIHLINEGMPLHVTRFIGALERIIEEDVKDPVSRKMIQHFLKRREREYTLENTTFLDFEEVLQIANKEKVTPKDYFSLQYFPDSELTRLLSEQELLKEQSASWKKKEREIEKRLDKNTALHHDIEQIRELGSAKEELENRFGNGRKQLQPKKDEEKDVWYETDLTKIIQWEEEVKSSRAIELYADQITCTTDEVTMWKRPKSSTAAGMREWNIILFSEQMQDEIELIIPFSLNTKTSFLTNQAKKFTETSGKRLKVTLEMKDGADFYRVLYRHEDESRMRYIFSILVLQDKPEFLQSVSQNYTINTQSKAKYALTIEGNETPIILGESERVEEVAITEAEQTIVYEGTSLQLKLHPSAIEESDTTKMYVRTPNYELPIVIKDETMTIVPKFARDIWIEKFQSTETIPFSEDFSQAYISDYPYSTHSNERPYLELERRWVKEGWHYAEMQDGQWTPVPLTLPSSIERAYERILNLSRDIDAPFTFIYYEGELREAVEALITSYIQEIQSIQNDTLLTEAQRNLFKLGRLDNGQELIYTSLSPMNMAYQLVSQQLMANEKLSKNTIERIRKSHVLPYLQANNRLYKPVSHDVLPEWTVYKNSETVQVGEANQFLAHVVKEKIEQFLEYYPYLFAISKRTPFKMNIVNIPDDYEIVKGIVQLYMQEIRKGAELQAMRPIEITSYMKSGTSAFETFIQLATVEQAEAFLQNLSFKNKFELERDVFIHLQRLIRFSKKSFTDEVKYAHLSFYKMDGKTEVVKQMMDSLPNSTSLNGLLVSPSSQLTEEGGYRIGFGIGSFESKSKSLLEWFVFSMNEFAANMMYEGTHPYRKWQSIATRVHQLNEQKLNELYAQSQWVTFINPEMDLTYFTEHEEDLIVVHYSDQLSSSMSFDAITVTNKSKQYVQVIQQFLEAHDIHPTQEEIEETIKAFNVFNGEWLLRAVQNKAYDKREKMSVLSALKQALRYFTEQAPDIHWVPISMEEIVRVSNAIHLSKKDGLFSGMTIGHHGNCSDDLLMMGYEIDEDDEIAVHFYPIEVKIGHNESSVISKGIEQVKALNARLRDVLERDTFESRFMRHFFMQRLITNAKKMHEQQFYGEPMAEEVEYRLLNNDFHMTNTHQHLFGEGLVLSFKKDQYVEDITRLKGVVVATYPEQLGYELLTKSMTDIFALKEFTYDVPAAPREETVISPVEERVNSVENEEQIHSKVAEPQIGEQQKTHSTLPETIVDAPVPLEPSPAEPVPETISQSRPLIGATNAGMNIYWEFDHKGLSNRHLVIGGRSGQGKTYFIQSLLMDLHDAKQPSLIIDYSASYTQHQLEEQFVQHVGEHLKERVVYIDKMPINPFKRRMKFVAGRETPEPANETANRVVEVFASVYRSFGDQQKMTLYRAIRNGIEKYEDHMTLTLLMDELSLLEDSQKSVVTSIQSRLTQLVDMDPFDYTSENNWDDLFTSNGQVNIIQLDGYEQIEIKKVLTEFILWDLWYFMLSNHEDRPVAVVLDEAQNLSFAQGAPSNLILREGRKFGWSAWFATQTFSQFTTEELAVFENAGTKIYFNPAESEVRSISKRLGGDFEEVLRSLKKGQCFVSGQFLEGTELGSPKQYVVQVPPMNSRK